MGDVSVKDLEGLIAFRQRLVRFNKVLEDEFRRMEHGWREAQQIWLDDKCEEFGQELAELWPGIQRYLDRTQGHEQHLRRMIEHLDAIKQLHVR